MARQVRGRKARQKGFSLIEIMVVVVIIGILAALIVPRLMDRPDQARVVAARQDIAALMQALKLFKLDNGRYPSAEQGLQALVKPPQGGGTMPVTPYLDRLPNDPWGHPYQYQIPGTHGDVDVFSLGADSKPGGDAGNADIGSWQL
ncbi:type II secretion system major pseudopilin GspG [Stenotrophomonas maltophilia]|jgi:general secretion pathway protein G|uniref:type II secretion system major pseudopilin GspG n=1 Tax=Stenotrophomonas geniculata TaxID=86188 RepID=UPI00066CB905|nr:type II secretion system major pseudopilin GspG [Stenotrophomonas geniculata]MBH1838477.1 type II secretion system major pseudopilin GspG [Stenotrophomonas maltophilia]MBN5131326.1 type II secretion system major pseudopilin GspG [Stenotrophomonas maltophilia]MBN5135991.1 type II secretion system major pseudopilin GspG [Stenotrophomonas maltophilia]MCI1073850.1 type II secretion system major pseudopilin GspG [Stenotrophomonas maltophilia]MCI1086039.1 type II secretion system major pseudopili